jgi:hypothetical protein
MSDSHSISSPAAPNFFSAEAMRRRFADHQAQVLDYPEGKPRNIGFFLSWNQGA